MIEPCELEELLVLVRFLNGGAVGTRLNFEIGLIDVNGDSLGIIQRDGSNGYAFFPNGD